ncbi:NADH:flavin oxidoreductase [Candidatus Bathyarchaeota archaeon]|nr:NADH:flavin oxidoreductase [Candidatus Bathyarchaeota archaeon]
MIYYLGIKKGNGLVRLLDSLKVGDITLKNRIVMPPMYTGFATKKGEVTKKLVDHYIDRCKNLGLLIIEHSYVAIDGKLSERQLGAYNESLISGLKKLSRRIQSMGTPVILQISHAGNRAMSEVAGIKKFSSSSNNQSHELESDEIKVIIQRFAKAAEWGIKAGFNGIEIHGAHGFLLNQFYSPITNKRSDQYGGCLENRLRFPLEVVREVKKKIRNKLLLYRLGSDDLDPRGTKIWESQIFAIKLENAGVNLIDVSGGICGSRPNILQGIQGYFVSQAQQIRKAVNVPVIGVGGIKEAEFANRLIEEEKVDLIAVGRQLFKDSDWATKTVERLKI